MRTLLLHQPLIVSPIRRQIMPLLIFLLLMALAPALVWGQEPEPAGLGLLDAVRLTLVNQPNIRIQDQQRDESLGGLLAAQGQFDTALATSLGYGREKTPLSLEDRITGGINDEQRTIDGISTNVSLPTLFRNGVAVQPGLTITRTDDSTSAYEPDNRARVDFLVTLPLMKGRGREATTANERAAEKAVKISWLDFQHTAAQAVYKTLASYWEFLAAQKRLEKLTEAQTQAKTLVEEVKALIAADQRPAADLYQVSAEAAEKSASRVAGSQSLIEARQGLGLAMGTPFAEIDSLRPPAQSFPLVAEQDIDRVLAVAKALIDQTLARRPDYLAAKQREAAALDLLTAAKNNLLPQVDLAWDLGYSGLDEGNEASNYVSSVSNNIPGLSVTVALNYKWPFANHAAQGLFLQRRAALEKSRINTAELGRGISVNVQLALTALSNSLLELDRCRDAVLAHQTSVRNEKTRFRMGMSTILDLITMENRLTDALLKEINAQQKCAKALASLRFETATLVGFDGEQASVGLEELTTLPSL